MIIVAQNRTRTVNFDLVEEINIKPNKNGNKHSIVAEMNSGKKRFLGTYETLEAAIKEKQNIEYTIKNFNKFLPIYYMSKKSENDSEELQ